MTKLSYNTFFWRWATKWKPWEVESLSRGTWDEDFAVIQKESSSENILFQMWILGYISTTCPLEFGPFGSTGRCKWNLEGFKVGGRIFVRDWSRWFLSLRPHSCFSAELTGNDSDSVIVKSWKDLLNLKSIKVDLKITWEYSQVFDSFIHCSGFVLFPSVCAACPKVGQGVKVHRTFAQSSLSL